MPRSEFAQGEMSIDPATLYGGAIPHVPLDEEENPELPSDALALRPPIGCLGIPRGFGKGPPLPP